MQFPVALFQGNAVLCGKLCFEVSFLLKLYVWNLNVVSIVFFLFCMVKCKIYGSLYLKTFFFKYHTL